MKKNLGPFGRIIESARLDARKEQKKHEAKKRHRRAFLGRIKKLFSELKKDPTFVKWLREKNNYAVGITDTWKPSSADDLPGTPGIFDHRWYLTYFLEDGVLLGSVVYGVSSKLLRLAITKMPEDDWRKLESPIASVRTAEQLAQFLFNHDD